MAPARGDRKPCTHTDCPGTMQFGREPLLRAWPRGDGGRGWVCSDKAAHFRPASDRSRPDTTTRSSLAIGGRTMVGSSWPIHDENRRP